MSDPCDLKIFHYHFMTGGVSTVVRQALASFDSHLPEIRSVELIAGHIPETFRFQTDQHSAKCTVVPQIGYHQPPRTPVDRQKAQVAAEANELARMLLERFGSDSSIWWIHNYHLGKNPVFTQALLEILYSSRPQRVILQIHDFPESGRYQNLEILKNSLSLEPYPVGPWIRYAVLNKRDRNILTAAGVPEEAVFLLENPVIPDPTPEPPKSPRQALKHSLSPAYSGFDPALPILLYPIRSIRRKNALEAQLLCLLLDRPANLLVTLPGISETERPYSDLVQRLFSEKLCPGLFGIGSELEELGLSFAQLAAASDLVVSTSVQEGFGYLFINALLWSLPLAARDLDTLAGLKGLFRDYPAHFYETIRVPVWDEEALLQAYGNKIRGLSTLIPAAEQERLFAASESIVEDGLVDFSFLPVYQQENLLRRIAAGENEVLDICRLENGALLSKITELLATTSSSATAAGDAAAEKVERRFGPAAYASGFHRIITSFSSPKGDGQGVFRSFTASRGGTDTPNGAVPHNRETGIGDRILRAFLEMDQLRLLYD